MRTLELPTAWTEKKINVVLIGCGGSGSSILSDLTALNGLLRALGGHGMDVTAFDGSSVSPANLYRQTFYHHDVGMNKAEVLIQRINQWTGFEWVYRSEHFSQDNAAILTECDLLITAVDLASVRVEISDLIESNCFDSDAMWLDLGNDDKTGQAYLSKMLPASKGEIPSPAQLFYNQWKEASKTESNTHSCSSEEAITKQSFGVNGMLARSAASMLLFPLFRESQVTFNGVFLDLSTGHISPMQIDPDMWLIYDYQSF